MMQSRAEHLDRQSHPRILFWLGLLIALTLVLAGLGFVDTAGAEPGVYDVRTYGAKGDGVTNDSAAIQAAVDAASQTGGTVTFPGGTFVLNSLVYVRSGITIVGVPGQTVLFMPAKSGPTPMFYADNAPSNVRIEGLTFRGTGPTDNVYGVVIYGAQNSRLSNLRFENLAYGMKLGTGAIARGWVVEDIVAVHVRMPLFVASIEDSSFSRLTLNGVKNPAEGQWFDHSIYLSEDSHRLTFKDLVLTGGSGYNLHLWGGTSSDITFENVSLDSTLGRSPLVIGGGWSNISFKNLSMVTAAGQLIMLASVDGLLVDGFTGSGGSALLDVYGGQMARNVTFRNGTYDGPTLPLTHPRVTNLVYENVTLGSAPPTTTTTTVPPTSIQFGLDLSGEVDESPQVFIPH